MKLSCAWRTSLVLFQVEENTNWHATFEIPEVEVFSDIVQEAVRSGIVTSRARREIIQMLRTLILQYTKYMTSEQYVAVCQKLVTKYPKLRDSVGSNGYVSTADR